MSSLEPVITSCDNKRAAALLQPAPEAVQAPVTDVRSYGQILTSSALIGGSSAINIAIGIVRVKAMAVLLGPGGFGLAGLYSSVTDLAQSIAGMGINTSGVRQIAEAVGSDEADRIARTTVVLRRTSLVLGAMGAILLVAFSRPVSSLTFGDTRHSGAICLLSLAVFFRLVSAGQGALIQGMRRIADLAKMSVFAALFGTLIGIPVVYVFREKGIVPSLVATAAVMTLASWWYSRNVRVERASMSVAQVAHETAALLKLGGAFMASGLLTMGVAYWVRITLLREVGVSATGLYQSAWTLGGLYVAFILQAMGADFYPRLTAKAKDNANCNRLVNEQALVSLLLAGPGVIATLTFAPIVITLFYSSHFSAAVSILRWICLGTTLQVITWPMGFIILAKGRQDLFFYTEFAWTLVYAGVVWISVKHFGLNGAGIAFFGSYIFHGLLIYPIVRHLSGFRWTRENGKTGIFFLSLIASVFCGFQILPFWLAVCIGTLALGMSSFHSARVLVKLVAFDRIPASIRHLITSLGFVPSGSEAKS